MALDEFRLNLGDDEGTFGFPEREEISEDNQEEEPAEPGPGASAPAAEAPPAFTPPPPPAPVRPAPKPKAKKKRKPKEEAPPWWTGEWIVPGIEPGPEPTPAEAPALPKIAAKPGIVLAMDTLKAEGEALRAEVRLSKAETRWLASRLRTLGLAVAKARLIEQRRKVQARLVRFRERLKTLQSEAIAREQARLAHITRIARDDDEFMTILRLVV